MGRVDTVAFDKTGTLTCGRLEVSDVIPFDARLTEKELLTWTAATEAKSEHPLGRAIVARAKSRRLPLAEAGDFKMAAGKGISATASGRRPRCGSEKYLMEHSVTIGERVQGTLEKFCAEGKASVLVAEGHVCIGVIALSDVLRPEAAGVGARLAAVSAHTVLLTGDNQKTADYFAQQVGISEVQVELLPEEKVRNVEALQADGRKVCMIGDGVNDAPALKAADVGVAMGNMGSDIAVEAADIALMSDGISKIPYLKRLSNATVRTIKFSIALSVCINFAAIMLSLLELLTPVTGALVHNGGSCLVVLIAALLYDRKFE